MGIVHGQPITVVLPIVEGPALVGRGLQGDGISVGIHPTIPAVDGAALIRININTRFDAKKVRLDSAAGKTGACPAGGPLNIRIIHGHVPIHYAPCIELPPLVGRGHQLKIAAGGIVPAAGDGAGPRRGNLHGQGVDLLEVGFNFGSARMHDRSGGLRCVGIVHGQPTTVVLPIVEGPALVGRGLQGEGISVEIQPTIPAVDGAALTRTNTNSRFDATKARLDEAAGKTGACPAGGPLNIRIIHGHVPNHYVPLIELPPLVGRGFQLKIAAGGIVPAAGYGAALVVVSLHGQGVGDLLEVGFN